ncbi:hypothetical protein CBI46_10130 [Clostridium perfringens A]|nr:hypothetical protein CYK64_09270 [Clostridium perfringens]TPG00117.1 hypothetical protein CBI46_10130 [Clostridium perfringens A]
MYWLRDFYKDKQIVILFKIYYALFKTYKIGENYMNEKIIELLKNLQSIEDLNIKGAKDYFLEKAQLEQLYIYVNSSITILDSLRIFNNESLKQVAFNMSMIQLNENSDFSVLQNYIDESRNILESFL